MAAFDSGAFDTGAFDTASAPATSVTSWRSVAEVISAYGEVKSRRVVAEALHLLPVTVPQPALTVGRAAVEAIGWAASYAGRRLSASRAVAEAVGTAGEQSPGLELPNISTTLSTLYLAFTPDTSSAGFIGLLDASGNGFSVSWASGASSGTVSWRLGAAVTTSSVTFTSPVTVLSLGVPAGATFRELGLSRPYGSGAGGTVHEVILFDANHGSALQGQVRTYLDEKWNHGGPVTYPDLCAALVPPPEPEGWEIHYAYAYNEEPIPGEADWIGIFDNTGMIIGHVGTIIPDDGHGGGLVITPGVTSSGTGAQTTLIWAGNAADGFTTAHLSWNGQSVDVPVSYTEAPILPGFDGFYQYQTDHPLFPLNEAPTVPVVVSLS